MLDKFKSSLKYWLNVQQYLYETMWLTLFYINKWTYWQTVALATNQLPHKKYKKSIQETIYRRKDEWDGSHKLTKSSMFGLAVSFTEDRVEGPQKDPKNPGSTKGPCPPQKLEGWVRVACPYILVMDNLI